MSFNINKLMHRFSKLLTPLVNIIIIILIQIDLSVS